MRRNKFNEPQSPRMRSVPYRGAFYQATFWTVLHLFCIMATITTIVIFFLHHKTVGIHYYKRPIIVFASLTILTMMISFYKRRNARCPLCLGTPLLNSGALVHKHSYALTPFNNGFTAVLSIIFTQKFRCMYCGILFDLLKKRGLSNHSKNNLTTPPHPSHDHPSSP